MEISIRALEISSSKMEIPYKISSLCPLALISHPRLLDFPQILDFSKIRAKSHQQFFLDERHVFGQFLSYQIEESRHPWNWISFIKREDELHMAYHDSCESSELEILWSTISKTNLHKKEIQNG